MHYNAALVFVNDLAYITDGVNVELTQDSQSLAPTLSNDELSAAISSINKHKHSISTNKMNVNTVLSVDTNIVGDISSAKPSISDSDQNSLVTKGANGINGTLPWKSQGINGLCWAASLASVGQYRTGRNLTAKQVHDEYYYPSTGNYDLGATSAQMRAAFSKVFYYSSSSRFNVTVTGYNLNYLKSHLVNDQPISLGARSGGQYTGEEHVITASKIMGGAIQYMNSGGASVNLAYPTSNYFTFGHEGNTFTVYEMFCPTGWHKWSSGWWYMLSTGNYYTGWHDISGIRYYFNPSSGRMYDTQWLQLNGSWYYLKSGGAMAKSESIFIKDKTYSFNSSGICTNP